MPQLAAIILAAGQGTRMKSKLPKVIHPLLGKPMLSYVIETAKQSGADPVFVVVGFGKAKVMEVMGPEIQYVWQQEQLGTGHAVKIARQQLLPLAGEVLVLYGDTPLLQAETIKELLELKQREAASAAILTIEMTNPTGYGRMIRNSAGDIVGIIEEKDASSEQKAITEVNTGVYCFDGATLLETLEEIEPRNAQGEYYLTDVFKILVDRGLKVVGYKTEAAEEVMGPNDRVQLTRTEGYLKRSINEHWMYEGVTITDPDHTYIGPDVQIGRDTTILPGTMLYGRTIIGEDCVIGPNCRIEDSIIANQTVIQFSQVLQAKLGAANQVGPFAYIRPGTETAANVKVGDFVELKNTQIGMGSKVPHLTYLGDTEVGSGVNIGAGTITCNYDGVNKHRTVIGDNAFIGSNANLVAPVTIGTGATIAAGSTITKAVPKDALGLARSKQENKANWRTLRKRN